MIEYFISSCYTFDLANISLLMVLYLHQTSNLSEKRKREIVTRYDSQSYDWTTRKSSQSHADTGDRTIETEIT